MSTHRRSRAIDEPITLSRVVTRGGDRGSTSLANGQRVLKCDPRVEAYGAVDELNATLGLAFSAVPAGSRFRPWLTRIQNDLFDLGADLAAPPEPAGRSRLRMCWPGWAAPRRASRGRRPHGGCGRWARTRCARIGRARLRSLAGSCARRCSFCWRSPPSLLSSSVSGATR